LATRRKPRAPAAATAFDALAAGLVAGLPRALVEGDEADLLRPLRFLAPGKLPAGRPPRIDRAALARSLTLANLAYGHPRASELAEKLADPETRVVVSGQQTGLFGGPLLSLVKAAAAVRWAEAIEASGRPAVALFWMATEDHDWDEVARAAFPSADGLRGHSLGDDPQPLAPVGLRTVGAAVVSILRELVEEQADPAYRSWLGRLMALWRPDARFGEAFARQTTEIFGARAPLLVDALQPALKRAEAPFLRQLVERRHELARQLAEADARIAARGFPLQVHPQPGASPLFLLRHHERRRIEWRGDDRFALRGVPGEEPVEALLATLDDNPAMVSPGVLARAAIQDALFGTTLAVVGPAELAYLAQSAPVHALLGLAAPWVALRPQAVVLDQRARRRQLALAVDLARLLADPEAVERALGERAGGGFVEPVRAEVAARIESMKAAALALDPALERPFAKTRESVAHALESFAAKVAAAAARRDEVVRRRFAQLCEAVRPDGRPQERVVSAAHFPGRFGPGFGAALLDQLGLDPRRLQVIVPDAAAESAGDRPPEAAEVAAGSAAEGGG
jgi:bacillithiol biosynthesis cysteine-adding enzyme BshC